MGYGSRDKTNLDNNVDQVISINASYTGALIVEFVPGPADAAITITDISYQKQDESKTSFLINANPSEPTFKVFNLQPVTPQIVVTLSAIPKDKDSYIKLVY